MPVKYVFVTGGVVRDSGKGITAASLGRLLKARGLRYNAELTLIHIDRYRDHPAWRGFVIDDGAETV